MCYLMYIVFTLNIFKFNFVCQVHIFNIFLILLTLGEICLV